MLQLASDNKAIRMAAVDRRCNGKPIASLSERSNCSQVSRNAAPLSPVSTSTFQELKDDACAPPRCADDDVFKDGWPPSDRYAAPAGVAGLPEEMWCIRLRLDPSRSNPGDPDADAKDSESNPRPRSVRIMQIPSSSTLRAVPWAIAGNRPTADRVSMHVSTVVSPHL